MLPAIMHWVARVGRSAGAAEVRASGAEELWRDVPARAARGGQSRRAHKDPCGGRCGAARLNSLPAPHERIVVAVRLWKLLRMTRRGASRTRPGKRERRRRTVRQYRCGPIGLVRAGDAHVRQRASVPRRRGAADLSQSALAWHWSRAGTRAGAVAGGGSCRRSATLTSRRAAPVGPSPPATSAREGRRAVAVVPSVNVKNGRHGMVLGWHVDVGENSRVLFGPLASVVFGFALGPALAWRCCERWLRGHAGRRRGPEPPWRWRPSSVFRSVIRRGLSRGLGSSGGFRNSIGSPTVASLPDEWLAGTTPAARRALVTSHSRR